MKFKIGDNILVKRNNDFKKGKIIGYFNEDCYLSSNNERILYASKGEYKIQLEGMKEGTYEPIVEKLIMN